MITMDLSKDVKEFIQALVKAKKNFRIYPANNPVYTRTIDDVHSRMSALLEHVDSLVLRVRQHEILFEEEKVYQKEEKEENLALFFFKDGIRELTFRRGLPREEMEDFLKVISVDFDREALDDDIVTLMWESDFQFIGYVADDSILLSDEDYEEKAVSEAKNASADKEDILKAYEEARGLKSEATVNIVPLTDDDLRSIIQEIEKDQPDKTITLIHLLFEMLGYAEGTEEIKELTGFVSSAVEYAITRGNLETVVLTIKKIHQYIREQVYGPEVNPYLKGVGDFVNSGRFVKLFGKSLDDGAEFDEILLDEFASLLDSRALPLYIHLLGELKSASARKVVIGILSELGRKDIAAVAKGLKDRRWYVVRNIICILRNIGDRSAAEYVSHAVGHPDRRVKKEAIRALGVIGTAEVLPVLRDCLSDTDELVRLAAVRSIGLIGAPQSRSILLDSVSARDFKNKTYNEKREFFDVLARWRDEEIIRLMTRTLKKRALFKRAQNDETRAAAAYGLGMIGSESTIDHLLKLRNSKNRLLRENVQAALKKIRDGQKKRS